MFWEEHALWCQKVKVLASRLVAGWYHVSLRFLVFEIFGPRYHSNDCKPPSLTATPPLLIAYDVRGLRLEEDKDTA